jgi:hypothetical protein
MLVFAAQIEDGLDTHLGQGSPGLGRRLATAVDVIVNLVEVGYGRGLSDDRPHRNVKGQSEGS